ncbi:uncharacterized protein LOC128722536 [Anopheles nili]|uniref:uncharacterized protein LOC128722536 n=1 Tax=Anopheles nili TaxID=185578 RepID=UPI00237A3F6D|nr:uncharacterized protein LOC128722536 [Anopheles nili]
MWCFRLAFVLITIVIELLLHPSPVVGQYTGPTLACGGTSLVKSTTLIAPNDISANGLTCVYTIRSLNLRVCQLRLDFNSFSLAQPTLDPYPRCINDVLSIENLNFDLCGENTGQHVYVPFNPTNADRTLTITFRIANRNHIPNLRNPHWSVRVQQLECPTGAAAASKDTFRQESAFDQPELLPLVARTFHNDIGMLAPTGCLQYFPDTTGTVESFNLGTGEGPYLGGLSYAVCFHRPRTAQALRLRPSVFEMAYVLEPVAGNVAVDELCYSSVASMERSEDHLLVPNAMARLPSLPVLRSSRFCGHSLVSGEVEVTAPGPFVMYFNSDQLFDPFRRETGFRMQYQIL